MIYTCASSELDSFFIQNYNYLENETIQNKAQNSDTRKKPVFLNQNSLDFTWEILKELVHLEEWRLGQSNDI